MSCIYRLLAIGLLLCMGSIALSQTTIKSKIIDANTKEPIEGATIRCMDVSCTCGCISTTTGEFQLNCKDCRQLTVSYIGYASQTISVANPSLLIALFPQQSLLQEVVVSANHGEGVKRTAQVRYAGKFKLPTCARLKGRSVLFT